MIKKTYDEKEVMGYFDKIKEKHDINYADMAKYLDRSYGTIFKWAKGQSLPPLGDFNMIKGLAQSPKGLGR